MKYHDVEVHLGAPNSAASPQVLRGVRCRQVSMLSSGYHVIGGACYPIRDPGATLLSDGFEVTSPLMTLPHRITEQGCIGFAGLQFTLACHIINL